MSPLATLYPQHLATLQQRLEAALAAQGFDALAIAAGVEKYAFLDDRPYAFQVNPHFMHWLPLPQAIGSWLLLRPGRRPQLLYLQAEDYWHAPPATPSGYWTEAVEVEVLRTPEQLAARLKALVPARCAQIAEADAQCEDAGTPNPEALLALLHFERGMKTPYELQLMRAASQRAVLGHLAAQAAFEAGGAEADIHAAYLAGSDQAERELPYGNIVALGEHGAVLHWQHQDKQAPACPTSLLIDAGASAHGYAADITRTWLHPGAGTGAAEFAALLAGMEALELALVDQVRAGSDYPDIHLDAHRRIAALLLDAGLIHGLSAEAAVAQGLSSTFFPHGVGHLLGAQVHDVAGLQVDRSGTRRERPSGHPYLRLTRRLEPGMVVTIEPGLYFIPLLLRERRASALAAHVDWDRVEALRPFGGIRIEDDVACRAEGPPENLTREAFALLGA